MQALAPLVPLLADAGMRSEYQLLKREVLAALPLSKDAIHIYIGVACLLASIFVFRFPPSAWRTLLLGFAASLVMEGLDLRDNAGYPWTLRAVETARDLLNTNLSPLLVVLALRLRYGAPPRPAKRKR